MRVELRIKVKLCRKRGFSELWEIDRLVRKGLIGGVCNLSGLVEVYWRIVY
jgi:hypothetical protein